MRYVEAYEIIRTALKKSDMELPLTGNFLSNFFDKHVNDIGLRVVRDKRSFDITPSGLSYMIGQNDFTDRVFKVESSSNNAKTLVPYVPDASIHSGLTTNEVDNIGYYVSHLTSKNGTITGATSANPCVITSVAHGLSVNDYVIISEMTGTGLAGQYHLLNGKRHKITACDADTFTLLKELLTRKDEQGDIIFNLNALPFDGGKVLLVTGLSVLKPVYVNTTKQEEE